jgi:hypothetical protein
MTEEEKEPEEKEPEAQVLPARELMSLLTPGGSPLPGLDGVLGGDPTVAAPAPTDTPAGNPADVASHAADGQTADSPSVSDQPQNLSSSSTHTESSET